MVPVLVQCFGVLVLVLVMVLVVVLVLVLVMVLVVVLVLVLVVVLVLVMVLVQCTGVMLHWLAGTDFRLCSRCASLWLILC